MPIQEIESVKFFFDHVKSVWTLSAGGLAATIALLGYIVKESRVAEEFTVGFSLGCIVAVGLFTYSIWKGLKTQVDLMRDVANAEASEQPKPALSRDLVTRYRKGRNFFFLGCVALIVTAMAFSILNARSMRSQSAKSLSFSNVVITTAEGAKTEIKDVTLSLPEAIGSWQGAKTVQIKEATFTIRVRE